MYRTFEQIIEEPRSYKTCRVCGGINYQMNYECIVCENRTFEEFTKHDVTQLENQSNRTIEV